MGVAVLNPHDCLKEPLYDKTLFSPPMKRPRNPNHRSGNRAPQPNRRKRSPSRPNNSSPPRPKPAVEKPKPAGNIIMGHVKILKRGEELKEKTASEPSPAPVPAVKESLVGADLDSACILGPDPESVRTQIRVTKSDRVAGFYAGPSSCIASPPPSSLPLPAFFSKKSVVSINDEATSALLKALRLDLA
ncbi:serine/arginine repetitive matrix-like protein [Parasponia andersonii]|uniref:Serine/arginine repetitive matrix-like protein n=1 Tax=Parasponia andersonii TaxID=3476 RepID=A0A2P5DDB5_PARAD|nr:serine/arginine repetitive matrix-like protein [Parasponia andersonii]